MRCAPYWQSVYGTLQASCNSFQGDGMHCVVGFINSVNSALVFKITSTHYKF